MGDTVTVEIGVDCFSVFPVSVIVDTVGAGEYIAFEDSEYRWWYVRQDGIYKHSHTTDKGSNE